MGKEVLCALNDLHVNASHQDTSATSNLFLFTLSGGLGVEDADADAPVFG